MTTGQSSLSHLQPFTGDADNFSEIAHLFLLMVVNRFMLVLMLKFMNMLIMKEVDDCVPHFLSLLNSSLPVSVHQRANRLPDHNLQCQKGFIFMEDDRCEIMRDSFPLHFLDVQLCFPSLRPGLRRKSILWLLASLLTEMPGL